MMEKEKREKCLECGETLTHIEGRKEKTFCDSFCRGKYYYKNKANRTPPMWFYKFLMANPSKILAVSTTAEELASLLEVERKKMASSTSEEADLIQNQIMLYQDAIEFQKQLK